MNTSFKDAVNNGTATTILDKALSSAAEAVRSARDKNPQLDMSWPCGFGWVEVHIHGGTKVAKFLKDHGFNKSYSTSGAIALWSSAGSQNMDMNIAWASAYAEVLSNHGLQANANGRMD